MEIGKIFANIKSDWPKLQVPQCNNLLALIVPSATEGSLRKLMPNHVKNASIPFTNIAQRISNRPVTTVSNSVLDAAMTNHCRLSFERCMLIVLRNG
jgi:hypothetical protein